MRQRSLALLAAATVGFLALAPTFAQGKQASPPDDPTTPTTYNTDDPSSADDGSGSPDDDPGSTGDGSGSTGDTSTTTTTFSSATTTTMKSAPAPGSGPSTTTTTMAMDDGSASGAPADDGSGSSTAPSTDSASGAPSAACAEDRQEMPAPAEGATEEFDVGDAGTVKVERASATELRIVDVKASDGWLESIGTPSGPRVKVKFSQQDAPDQIVKFAAALSSDGSALRFKVSDCRA